MKPPEEANHHPRAALNGDTGDGILMIATRVGERLSFDATGSTDPDGDGLRYVWRHYQEAGKRPMERALEIEGATEGEISLIIPKDAAGRELHLILEVWDENGIVPLVDYRRVVIEVEEEGL